MGEQKGALPCCMLAGALKKTKRVSYNTIKSRLTRRQSSFHDDHSVRHHSAEQTPATPALPSRCSIRRHRARIAARPQKERWSSRSCALSPRARRVRPSSSRFGRSETVSVAQEIFSILIRYTRNISWTPDNNLGGAKRERRFEKAWAHVAARNVDSRARPSPVKKFSPG